MKAVIAPIAGAPRAAATVAPCTSAAGAAGAGTAVSAGAAGGDAAAHRDPICEALPLSCTKIWQEYHDGTSSHDPIR